MAVHTQTQVLSIQRMLQALGYDPATLDGVIGPRTRAAIRAFQRDHGLRINGVAGPVTCARLQLLVEPRWLAIARRHLGLAERDGPASNALLLQWATHLGLAYRDDAEPWCGLFVAHCLRAALPAEPLPDHALAARSWRYFGQACAPMTGAVLIFWRDQPKGWTGHVGFCIGADADAFHLLGGNQGNRVSIVRIARQRLLGARWPVTVPAPVDEGLSPRVARAPLSRNEA